MSVLGIVTVMLTLFALLHLPSARTEDTAAPASGDFAVLKEIMIKGAAVSVKTDKPATYNAFKVGNPDRLVIELSNTENGWKRKEVVLKNNAFFSRVRAAQFQNAPAKIARVVIDLKSAVEFETSANGNLIVLTAKKEGGTETPASAEAPKTEAPAAAMSPTPLAAPTPSEMVQSPDATPPAQEPAAPESKPARKFEMTAPNTGSSEMPKKAETTNAASNPSSMFGRQSVTLDFYDIDVRDLFKILSEKAGVNVVYGGDVTGTVSIQLRDVPFEEAIDTVLSLKGLRMIVLGKNIVQVMSPTEYDKYKMNAISATKVFPINYAKASDVNTQLFAINNTLGGKGKLQVDDRTNSIIVTDTPEGIETAAKLIQDLDKPAPQVMIEAKIVQVSLGKNLDLGITWGVAYTDQSGNQMVTIGATRNQNATNNASPGSSPNTAVGAPANVGLMTRSPVNPSDASFLEAAGSGFSAAQGLGLTFGFVKDVVRLNAALSALQQKNKSKLLSNPKIATLNNQTAKIASTTSEPYITNQTQLTNAGSLTSQVVNQALSGISLNVTPTINADGRITMKIVPDITSSQPTAIGVPKTTSQSANTTVIVKDGETFVIGGLISETESDSKAYVPLLGSIPLIGHLFKKTSTSKQRAELLVFVTPKIIPY